MYLEVFMGTREEKRAESRRSRGEVEKKRFVSGYRFSDTVTTAAKSRPLRGWSRL